MAVISRAIFDLVDRVTAAASVSDVWSAYLGAASNVGLGSAVACFISQNSPPDFQLIANALPDGCWEAYVQNNLSLGDLVAERIRTNVQSFEWKLTDWNVRDMSPAQKRWHDHCAAFGLLGGLCVLDFNPAGLVVLALCGADNDLDSGDRQALHFAGLEVISRLRELTAAVPATPQPLSERERECLKWVAEGKTDWEIGKILSLSEKTVNVYIERAKTKFGVKSRAQAVVMAAKLGNG